MKNVGVWIDGKKAIIIVNGQKKELLSEVDHFKIHGGSGTKFKGGPQDVVHDSKYLEREKHQLKLYFDRIIAEINTSEALVIFGPGDVNEKFNKEIQANHKALADKVKGVISVNYLTENQIVAWVKDFFEN